jgi:hypothetical protein
MQILSINVRRKEKLFINENYFYFIFQGYALFSHCVVLFLATFIHTGHDHLLFYGLLCFVSGAAAIRMVYSDI